MSGEDDLGALTWDADATLGPDEVESSPAMRPGLLDGRYDLGELIGRGGSGQVHLATDQLTGDTVAVKFVHDRSAWERRQIRRELTALRLLDLPGVLRLRDDGEHEGRVFLVMDYAPNGSIDKLAGPWAEIAPPLLAVLETLGQLHAVGVIHRDLKPWNLLLDAEDRPVIADFGLAVGEGIERTDTGIREGSPRYAAPEQWQAGECDARSDLFSMGMVAWDLLELGEVPEETEDRLRVLEGKVPAVVARTIVAMIAFDPEERPATVREVLAGLGEPEAPWREALPPSVDRESLESLIAEPTPTLLHLAEDAAAALERELARTGDGLGRVLGRWERAGWIRWLGEGFHVDRESLEDLRWQTTDEARELARLGRAGEELELVQRALEVAGEARAAGRPNRAAAVLDSVIAALDDPALADDLCDELVATVLELGRETALRRAMGRVEPWDRPELVRLLRGALLAARTDFPRALRVLADPGDLDEELQTWRLGLIAQALGRIDPAGRQKWLADVEDWCAEAPARRASWLGWVGLAAYAAGDYRGALTSHEESAMLLVDNPPRRLIALTNAASAALEIPDPPYAENLAAQAATLARSLRNPLAEGRARWVQRAAAYRSGKELPAVPGLVDAAAAISRGLEAQLAISEAAAAWRAGELEVARGLALRGAAVFRSFGFRGAVALALGLALASGAEVDLEEAREAVAKAEVPSLALQAICLGLEAGVDLGREHAGPALAGWHLGDPAVRADALSLDECRALLEGA